jgi:hypothetical protein
MIYLRKDYLYDMKHMKIKMTLILISLMVPLISGKSQNNWIPFDQSDRKDFEITNIQSSSEKVECFINCET